MGARLLAPAVAPGRQVTVAGHVDQVVDGVGTVVGSFTPTRFSSSGGALDVTGLLRGTFTPAVGVASPLSRTLTTPVAAVRATGSCTTLDLTLGPLHVDLPELAVDLERVHLTVSARHEPDDLLGHLLCAVAHLLASGTGLSGVADLLNRSLGL